jgi:hypothetical protein
VTYDGADDSRKCYALAIALLRKEFIRNMRSADICKRAAEMVDGDRARQHGNAHESFALIARMWNAYLEECLTVRLSSVDVAHMMALLKITRTQTGEFNLDNWIDGVGYIALAGELAAKDSS